MWRLVAEMSAEELVKCVDFRYITDAITPDEAIELLKEGEKGKSERMREAEGSRAVPAYTTSAGWLGYEEEKMRRLLEETLAKGYKHFKLKVGASLEDDKRRLTIARDVIGYDKGNTLMVDANQVLSTHPCHPSNARNVSLRFPLNLRKEDFQIRDHGPHSYHNVVYSRLLPTIPIPQTKVPKHTAYQPRRSGPSQKP